MDDHTESQELQELQELQSQNIGISEFPLQKGFQIFVVKVDGDLNGCYHCSFLVVVNGVVG